MKDILIISAFAGIVGTGLGGVLGIFFGSKSIGKTLGFTGGIMIGIVFFDIIPIILQETNVYLVVLSILIGIFFVALIDNIIIDKNENNPKVNNYYKIGLILLISMALHNFPEGMAIGTSRAVNIKSAILIGFVIALHDIPEGMSIATPLTGAKISKIKIITFTIISGLSTIIGAVIGLMIGRISEISLSLSLGFAGGAMLYVTFGELLPGAYQNEDKKSVVYFTIIGIVISLLFFNIF